MWPQGYFFAVTFNRILWNERRSERESGQVPRGVFHRNLVYCHIPRWVSSGEGNIMKKCMDADNLHRRLNKVSGQINAINKMIDEDVPCEDVLIQINAAKSALHKVGQVVLEGHLNHCVKEGIEHGDAEKTVRDFAKAVEHFSRMS
jgi:DNA-binding FrmR family transcriptional regulator